MSEKYNVRLNYLSSLFLKCTVALISGALLSSLIAWFFYGSLESPSYGAAMTQMDRIQLSLFRVTLFCAVAQVLLAVGLLWIIGIYASNKIAGPLVRFEKCLRDLGAGNLLQSIKFRAGDQDQRLPLALQATCTRLRERIKLGKESADEIADLRVKLEKESPAELSVAELQAVLAFVSQHKAQLKKIGRLKAYSQNQPDRLEEMGHA